MKTILIALLLVATCAHGQSITDVRARTSGVLVKPTSFFTPGTNIIAGAGIALAKSGNGISIAASGLFDGLAVTNAAFIGGATNVTATVDTVDATVTNIYAFTVRTDSAVSVMVQCVAKYEIGTDAAAYIRAAAFHSDNGITATEIGADTSIATHEDAGAATWDVTIDSAGGTIRVRVTGEAGRNIRWRAFIRIITEEFSN